VLKELIAFEIVEYVPEDPTVTQPEGAVVRLAANTAVTKELKVKTVRIIATESQQE